jgi:Ca2+-binding EF-hand superfamily protein
MSSDPYNIDIKIIQSFKPEDYTTYEKIFKNVDKEKNGTINQKGITEILNSLGYRDIPEEDSKELFDKLIQIKMVW